MRTSRWWRAGGLVLAGALAVAGTTISGSVRADSSADTSADTSAGAAAGETATTVRVGPFVLPPAPMGEAHVNRPIPSIPKPCEDCFITAIEPRFVTADGQRADMSKGLMLHHVVITEPGATDVTCGRNGVGALGRRLFAAGDERTPIRLPDGFGFRVQPGPWAGIIEMMNHSDTPQVVFFETVVHHVPASTPGMKPVTPVWLDAANCGTSEFAVPAGKSATPWTWTSSLTGRIVAAGGHVHAGGVGLTLDNVTTDQRICSSRAGYGTGAMEGMISRMSTCSWDSLGALHAGDELLLTSLYHAHEAMNDVMGIMLIAVHETDDVDGGTRAPEWMRRTPQTHVPGSGHHGGPGHGH
ncbi:hypothetical protein [Sporichthya polymorpha]|uniref:hypothetical protein n=1 Tax=Sporichthya polymorpha TaxID=35751 RepID=UPI0012ECA440|nr:hypothetical protein [Sporichthya polymorpha]